MDDRKNVVKDIALNSLVMHPLGVIGEHIDFQRQSILVERQLTDQLRIPIAVGDFYEYWPPDRLKTLCFWVPF